MPFWPIVIGVLIGAPMALYMIALGTIFGAAALGNANNRARANTTLAVGLSLGWLVAAAFGALGLMPAWRAWHGGAHDFSGVPASFVHWLAGTGVAALAVLAWFVVEARLARKAAAGAPPSRLVSWLAIAFVMVAWGAIIAWLAWPLVLWPIHGHFEWPDAATGWTHTAAIGAVLFGAGVLETVVRRLLRR